jgi:hypothetical protein
MEKYKFLRTGLKSNYNGFQWTLGKWHKTECKELCVGFNCSERVIDALMYVKGEILCKVESRGKSFTDNDKSTWEKMRIIRAWHWTKEDSVAMAVFAAELVIDIYEKKYPNDERPRKAIEAAKIWLKNPSDKNADAHAAHAAYAAADAAAYAAAYAADAAYSAYSAARAAAYAAAYAADAAAHAAANAAAHAAAHAAANAADAAANAAADTLDKIEAWIQERIKTLKEYKDE